MTATPGQHAGIRADSNFSYYSSAFELRQGSTVGELSLGQLPDELVAEFLRMRQCWTSVGSSHQARN